MRQYRGNSGESRRLERRARLLDAARRIFAERGFHGATVRAVCEAAGLTERYFYESFQNGENLFIAMHKEKSEHIIREIAAAATRCEGLPIEKVRAMLTAYYNDILRDPASARLFAVDAAFISPAANEVCASWRNAFGRSISQAFGSAVGTEDPIARSGVILALLGIGVEWMESGFSVPVEQIVDAGMKIAVVLRPA